MADFKPELVVSFDARELRRWCRLAVKLARTFDRLTRCRLAAEPRLCRRLDRLTDEFEAVREGFLARVSTGQGATLATFPMLKGIDFKLQTRLAECVFSWRPGLEVVADTSPTMEEAARRVVAAFKED